MREGHHADEGFTGLNNCLADAPAVAEEYPVLRRCRTIDRGGIPGGVIDCPMGRLFFAAVGLCHRHRQQREQGACRVLVRQGLAEEGRKSLLGHFRLKSAYEETD